MRTTVDLPAEVHRQAVELARERRQSLSSTIAELTARGLGELDRPLQITIDERSGFPTITIGRPITAEQVADLIEDE